MTTITNYKDSSGVDFGTTFIDKDYLIDVYPNIVPTNILPGLWSCGYNTNGQLGLGDVTNRSSPVQVGSLTYWKSVAAGSSHTVAVKTDGTLWSWGYNLYGQLGLGDIGIGTNRSSPVQVGSLTNWKQVTGGYFHTVAVKTDGTLWSWGYNYYGQLGLGDVTYRSSPVQVGSLTYWKSVAAGSSHTVAVKTDGTLWSWGYNLYGQLGLGDIGIGTNRSSPVQVGSLTNWKQVTGGNNHTVAVKTDGTLWSWGLNNYGQLGLGDITHRSSPVQVGSLTNWKSVASGAYYTVTIKTDGTLWSCGYNLYGQLGLGDVNSRLSPVQVGSLTNWKQVAAGYYHTVAISEGNGF